MPTNNFKLFDQNKANLLSDTEYANSAQRLNGVQTGVASSQLNNKFAYQVSLVAYAIAQIMNQNGLDASDTLAVSAFVGNLGGALLQKVADKASKSEAESGSDVSKWMSPFMVKAYITYILATITEAQQASVDTKWMSPAKVKAFHDYIKATSNESKAGLIDTKWISPKTMLDAIRWYERSSYIAFCSNVNSDSLDAAFGKNNESNMFSVGNQLAMYSWFKGDSTIANPYTVIRKYDTLSQIYSNISAIIEVEHTGSIVNIINKSPYAKSIRDAALNEESVVCTVIASRSGLPNPGTFNTVLDLTANSTFMNSQENVSMAFTYPLFTSKFCNNNTNWVRMVSYIPCMRAFEMSDDVNSYLEANKAALLEEKQYGFSASAVYVHKNNGLNIENFRNNSVTIRVDLDGKTYQTAGSGDKIGTAINRKFFKPCTFSVSGGESGNWSLTVKVIS